MKISILALHLGFGGIEKFICNIANMLSEDNSVEIISVYKLYDKPSFYLNSNVKIEYLIEDLKPNREEFYDSLKKFKIIELIKQSYIAIKILYLKKQRMKNAVKNIESDITISTIAPHNKLLSKYGKSKIKIATEHNYKDVNKAYINKVVNSCKNINYLVIASKELAKKYNEQFKNRTCKVINIPLSLDTIPEKCANLDNKNITYIGRLSKEKGVLDLIEVFKLVHEKDKDFILNVVGDGNKKDEINEKIKQYNLENNVIMHGFKTKEEIEKILLNTSIGINTSYTESFGLAVLETFSYGVPCVAFSSAEGLREVLDNGVDGYLIENRDFEKMANSIIELAADKEKLNEFAKNAREKSLKYEQKNIKKKWLELM